MLFMTAYVFIILLLYIPCFAPLLLLAQGLELQLMVIKLISVVTITRLKAFFSDPPIPPTILRNIYSLALHNL